METFSILADNIPTLLDRLSSAKLVIDGVSIQTTVAVAWRTLDGLILDHLRSNGFTFSDLLPNYQFHQSLWVLLKLGRINANDGLQKFVKDPTTVSNFTGQYLSRSSDISPRECDSGIKVIFVGEFIMIFQ